MLKQIWIKFNESVYYIFIVALIFTIFTTGLTSCRRVNKEVVRRVNTSPTAAPKVEQKPTEQKPTEQKPTQPQEDEKKNKS